MRATFSSSWLSAAVLATVAMLVVPLPPPLLDALLSCDVAGAAVVLVVALSVREPLEFSGFPTLMLVATLFRLSLDVSATRLILTQGDQPGAVGSVIPAFGDFVIGGSVVVGLLLFGILIIAQLAVVANGAQRVAEVAARFTLDAMPGKQMAIDADLHSGIIDAPTARLRRLAVQAAADFYGAMDGAGKFVRGDAIAALAIVVINVVAGFGIGVIGKHLDPATAMRTYALLSVGNALATTIPAFLLSIAMGVIVTRASSAQAIAVDLARQLLAHPFALRTVGAAMLGLALVPGLPHAAFATLGAIGIAGGTAAATSNQRRAQAQAADEARRRRALARQPESAVELIGVNQLTVEVGRSLLSLLDEPAASAILHRIALVRRALAVELGIVLPGVHIKDDLRLPDRGFAVRVRERVVGAGELFVDRPLAIGSPAALSALAGDSAIDPVSEAEAKWLEGTARLAPEQRERTLVVDPIAVLASMLAKAARAHAWTLLGRQEVQALLDHVRTTHPAAVKGVVPELASLGLVQRVLQHLVRERVSIRDLVAILETIADEAESTKDATIIGEAARRRLAPFICSRHADTRGTIRAALFSQTADTRLNAACVQTEAGPLLDLDAAGAFALREALACHAESTPEHAVVICSQAARLPLARFAETAQVEVAVLGLTEVAVGYIVEAVTTIDFTNALTKEKL